MFQTSGGANVTVRYQVLMRNFLSVRCDEKIQSTKLHSSFKNNIFGYIN